jgi:hypothetical protein
VGLLLLDLVVLDLDLFGHGDAGSLQTNAVKTRKSSPI